MILRTPVIVLSVFLGIFGLSSLFGQANTASIRGIITDASNAVVPRAEVILTNTGTGTKSSVKTNDVGEYLFEFLAPGNYKVEAQAPGFKSSVRDNITLELARQLRIDMRLETGQVTETLDVTGQAPLVETENGSLGTT